MTEHLPECPILKPCCDDEQFPEHGFCGNYVGRCLHCMAECICDALRACEERVLNAAREAVLSAVATKTRVVIHKRYEDGMDLDDEYDTGWLEGMQCALGVSLTNIDAIRKDSHD